MNLLRQTLLAPASIRLLEAREWDLLVRQARHANLLGRLFGVLQAAGLEASIPARPHGHLLSGAVMAECQRLSIRREAIFLRDALARYDIPLILLKGAAYAVAGLPAAQGRVFADIDILVPHERLAEAESALLLSGWYCDCADAYDQRYYRQWMHELPAMQHRHRGTSLDVHHTILPPTSHLKPDARLLIRASIEVPGLPGVRTLGLADLILHSAAHLFHEGEADNLLRDLTDLDLLLRHLGDADSQWEPLVERAAQLQLDGPLRLALRYTQRLLDTPLPERILTRLACLEPGGPAQKILDLIYARVLRPQHPSTRDWLSAPARKLLYLRSHWLRMPPQLLTYHLLHKALFPPKTRPVTAPAPVNANKAA